MNSLVKVLKLVSGEEIVSTIEESTDYCDLIKPCRIFMINTEEGMGWVLMPLVPYSSEETIRIKKDKIVYGPLEVDSDMRNKYSEQTGGITTPEKKIIT